MPFKDPEARKAYAAKHYEENKKEYLSRNYSRARVMREYVQELKTNTPCADCNKHYHFSQMQFDHINDDKAGGVRDLMRSSSLRVVKEEIAKCELVCANCHALRTWQRAK